MGLGMGRTRGSVAVACLRLLVASLCAAAVLASGAGSAVAPSLLQSHDRVSSQPRVVPMPPPLSDVLDQPAAVPGGYPMALTAQVGNHHVHASWTYVDGLPAFNAQIDSWLLGLLDAA